MKPFHSVIRTSSRVKAQPLANLVISSPTEGQITLFRVIGENVRKAEVIASISGGGVEKNLEIKINGYLTAF